MKTIKLIYFMFILYHGTNTFDLEEGRHRYKRRNVRKHIIKETKSSLEDFTSIEKRHFTTFKQIDVQEPNTENPIKEIDILKNVTFKKPIYIRPVEIPQKETSWKSPVYLKLSEKKQNDPSKFKVRITVRSSSNNNELDSEFNIQKLIQEKKWLENYLANNHHNSKYYQKDPEPYYDPTRYDKIQKIMLIENRINILKNGFEIFEENNIKNQLYSNKFSLMDNVNNDTPHYNLRDVMITPKISFPNNSNNSLQENNKTTITQKKSSNKIELSFNSSFKGKVKTDKIQAIKKKFGNNDINNNNFSKLNKSKHSSTVFTKFPENSQIHKLIIKQLSPINNLLSISNNYTLLNFPSNISTTLLNSTISSRKSYLSSYKSNHSDFLNHSSITNKSKIILTDNNINRHKLINKNNHLQIKNNSKISLGREQRYKKSIMSINHLEMIKKEIKENKQIVTFSQKESFHEKLNTSFIKTELHTHSKNLTESTDTLKDCLKNNLNPIRNLNKTSSKMAFQPNIHIEARFENKQIGKKLHNEESKKMSDVEKKLKLMKSKTTEEILKSEDEIDENSILGEILSEFKIMKFMK